VAIPLGDLARPWAAARFRAFCRLPDPAPDAPPDRLLRGLALRLPARSGVPSRLEAFCLTCTHEICEVELRDESAGVRLDDGSAVAHDGPLFVCPCHFSAFDPLRAGERRAGPAPRGLYRFRSWVAGERLEIVAVEAAALR
jgi:Rieske Fe-S protein